MYNKAQLQLVLSGPDWSDSNLSPLIRHLEKALAFLELAKSHLKLGDRCLAAEHLQHAIDEIRMTAAYD